jgi:hypothetical protein
MGYKGPADIGRLYCQGTWNWCPDWRNTQCADWNFELFLSSDLRLAAQARCRQIRNNQCCSRWSTEPFEDYRSRARNRGRHSTQFLLHVIDLHLLRLGQPMTLQVEPARSGADQFLLYILMNISNSIASWNGPLSTSLVYKIGPFFTPSVAYLCMQVLILTTGQSLEAYIASLAPITKAGPNMLTRSSEIMIICLVQMYILSHKLLQYILTALKIDHRHPAVRKDLLEWSTWILKVRRFLYHDKVSCVLYAM